MNSPPTDLIGHSLITGETLASEFRDEIVVQGSLFAAEGRAFQSAIAAMRNLSVSILPLFAESYWGSDVAAWISAFDHNTNKFPGWLTDYLIDSGRGKPPGVLTAIGDELPSRIVFPKIKKAAESLINRNVLTREDFDRLNAAAKAKAFTMAGETTERTIEKARDILSDLTAKGPSLDQFEKQFEEQIGKSAIGPHHVENVYRTNIQSAYRDGRESLMQNPIVASVFPYQEYLPIGDDRTRKTHMQLGTLGLDGTGIYRRDDPFWDRFTPPWDYNCRCSVNLLTLEAAARKGVTEAQDWLETGQPPSLPKFATIPFDHVEGFGQRGGALLI